MKQVDTIADGNCMFAAFAMAIRNAAYNRHQQSALAKLIRSMVTRYMTDVPGFWERFRATGAELVDQDIAAYLPKTKDAAIAATWPAPGAKEAYIRLMSRNGVWGGHLELTALGELFSRRIVVHLPNARTIGIGQHPKTVHLHYVPDNHYSAMIDSGTNNVAV
jgi:hypothetical protein